MTLVWPKIDRALTSVGERLYEHGELSTIDLIKYKMNENSAKISLFCMSSLNSAKYIKYESITEQESMARHRSRLEASLGCSNATNGPHEPPVVFLCFF